MSHVEVEEVEVENVDEVEKVEVDVEEQRQSFYNEITEQAKNIRSLKINKADKQLISDKVSELRENKKIYNEKYGEYIHSLEPIVIPESVHAQEINRIEETIRLTNNFLATQMYELEKIKSKI